jgi:glycosyltransferase involved in cell wall biosynthesis
MRILLVHNRYQIAGGEEVVVRSEKELLESHQQEVELLEVDNTTIAGAARRILTGFSAIYSRSGKKQVEAAIKRFRPEVVHVHNFFPLLSPSIYDACRAHGLPVVQTLHNYRLICPNALCFRSGHPCEDCLGKPLAWPGVLHACYRRSRLGTAAIATMLATHKLAGTWHNKVNIYIALTEFTRAKFIRGGLPADRIVVKPNFIRVPTEIADEEGSYALYVGRLSEEKGIRVLLQAWEKLRPAIPLIIAGHGPMENEVTEATQRNPAIRWEGKQERAEIFRLMGKAKILIIPSIWYEGAMPTVGLEAWAVGVPVVASDIGNLAATIQHGRTGLLFAPGNPQALVDQVRYAFSHNEELRQIRENAHNEFLTHYTPEHNYEMLMNIYERALQRP